jgi:hypothetical protein
LFPIRRLQLCEAFPCVCSFSWRSHLGSFVLSKTYVAIEWLANVPSPRRAVGLCRALAKVILTDPNELVSRR